LLYNTLDRISNAAFLLYPVFSKASITKFLEYPYCINSFVILSFSSFIFLVDCLEEIDSEKSLDDLSSSEIVSFVGNLSIVAVVVLVVAVVDFVSLSDAYK